MNYMSSYNELYTITLYHYGITTWPKKFLINKKNCAAVKIIVIIPTMVIAYGWNVSQGWKFTQNVCYSLSLFQSVSAKYHLLEVSLLWDDNWSFPDLSLTIQFKILLVYLSILLTFLLSGFLSTIRFYIYSSLSLPFQVKEFTHCSTFIRIKLFLSNSTTFLYYFVFYCSGFRVLVCSRLLIVDLLLHSIPCL